MGIEFYFKKENVCSIHIYSFVGKNKDKSAVCIENLLFHQLHHIATTQLGICVTNRFL